MVLTSTGITKGKNNNLLPDIPINRRRGNTVRKTCVVVICLAMGIISGCQAPPISLTPLPSRIDRIEGHASLSITGEQGSARSKFSFVFQLPSKGRIDVSGALGSVLYRIFITDADAFFILPSKKVYWKGKEEDIIEKFMGFRLNLYEMINLLSGKWDMQSPGGQNELEGWVFVKDLKGRIVSGYRKDLRFEVKAFVEDTSFVRQLHFEHPLNTGQVKVLSIGLNRPINPKAFSKEFIERYQSKTWEEIQELLNHAL
jgi:hypothetical protein